MKKYSFARSGTTRALLFAILLFTFSACDSSGGGDSGTNPDPNPKPTPVKEVAGLILSGDMPSSVGQTEEITATVLDQDGNPWTEQELADSNIAVNFTASNPAAVSITKNSAFATKANVTATLNCPTCVISAQAGETQGQNAVSGQIYPDITKLTTAYAKDGNNTYKYNIAFEPVTGKNNLYKLIGLTSEGAGGDYYIEGNFVKAVLNVRIKIFTIVSIENGVITKLAAQTDLIEIVGSSK